MHLLISGDEVKCKPLQMASIMATLFHPSTPSKLLPGSSGIRGGGSEKAFSSIFHPLVLPEAPNSSYPHFPPNFSVCFLLLLIFFSVVGPAKHPGFFCLLVFLLRIACTTISLRSLSRAPLSMPGRAILTQQIPEDVQLSNQCWK